MYSPLHKFAYHSSDHWRAVEASVCSLVFLYSNITNPRRAVSSSQYNSVVCPLTPPTLWAPACLVIDMHLIDLKCDMEHLQPHPVCFSGVRRDLYRERERVCEKERWKPKSPHTRVGLLHSLGCLAAEYGTDRVFTPSICNPGLWFWGRETTLNIAGLFSKW